MKNIKKPIVIVGSGFGGINAALHLRENNPEFSILVIDSKSQFEFKPLLYEVFSEEIKSWEVNPSFESITSIEQSELFCLKCKAAFIPPKPLPTITIDFFILFILDL